MVVFNPLKGAALATAVKAEAARLGCTIDAAAVAALIEVAGEDQARVFNELAKLRLAVGAGGAIDGAAVARYAAGYVHHGAFDIVDAISRRDLPGSLRLIGEVTIKDEEFLGLLGMLGKRLRVLWYLAGGAREVPKEFRVYPEPARQAAARREALHARRDRAGPAGAGAARRPGQEHGGRAETAARALPARLPAGPLRRPARSGGGLRALSLRHTRIVLTRSADGDLPSAPPLRQRRDAQCRRRASEEQAEDFVREEDPRLGEAQASA